MKKLLILIGFIMIVGIVRAQVVYPIRADTLKVYTGSTVAGAGGELLLQNASKGVLNGLLTNTNYRGNTEFRNLALTSSGNIPSGSILAITGQGSVALPWLKPYVDTMYLSAGNLLYQKNGTTYTVTLPVDPVYTASNLITKTGNNFTLGGTATVNTSLTMGTNSLTLTGTDALGGSSSYVYNSGASSGSVFNAVRGTTNSSITNLYNTVDITSETTGGSNSLIRATPVLTSMNLTTAGKTSSLSLSTGLNLVNDGISAVGLSYADNYAENNIVNPRWLVDRNYVDSSIIAGAGSGYTAGNLLSLATNTFELGGGNATHFTQLPLGLFGISIFGTDATGTGSSLEVNASSSSNIFLRTVATTSTSTVTTDEFGVNINNLSSSGANRSQVNMVNNKASINYLTGIGTGSQAISEIAMQAGGNVITDAIAGKGIRYAFNYGANNTGDPRWLTDKGYVDSMINNGGPIPTLQQIIDQSNSVTSPGVFVNFNSSAGTAGAALNLIDYLGAQSTIVAFNDGTKTISHVELRADTSKIVTTHDLLIATDAGVNYGIIHNDGRFTDGSGRTKQAYRTITATGPLLNTDYTILVNNSGAATLTLPPAVNSDGQIMIVKKLSAGSLDITLDGSLSETIDGAATQTMTIQYSSVMLQCIGTGWVILDAFTGGTPF